ncbi:MAG: radical SAM protein [Oscillospiraceae bacterium]|nr:radical SAM protein [Oscillospiraceae bacterium]
MSRYILNPNIALRSWWFVPYAYYIRNVRDAKGLKKEEFEFLLQCDGKTEIADTPLAERFLHMGFIAPARDGDALSEWQKHLDCNNRYFPAMEYAITGKCNYNCLHCFNAADNAPDMSEWTLDEVKTMLKQARKCGLHAITLTGGEPMLHKNFFEIVEEIYKHGMYVGEININGHFINQAALDRLKKLGCYPIIKISFDGIGHHDWLRNRKGAEKNALSALQLCKENGFEVWAQTNVHRQNIDTILPTAKMLDEMGIDKMRIIRTSESPRWKENAGDSCLSVDEYYNKMYEFTVEYSKEPHRMDIDIWQFLTIFPGSRTFRVRPVECAEGEYRDSLPVCRGNRGKVAVAANGNVYPCLQLSGLYDKKKDFLGNIKTTDLQTLLQGGKYLDEVCTTVKTLAENNSKCAACNYFKYCVGGCRALAYTLTDDKLGSDPAKCVFFKKGYYEKITALLDGWNNLAPIGNKSISEKD